MKAQQTETEKVSLNGRRPFLIFHPDTLETLKARPEDYRDRKSVV